MADDLLTQPGTPVQLRPAAIERKTRRLLPEAFCRPLALLFAAIVPQAVLLLLNWHAYLLISGDMSPGQKTTALLIFGLGSFMVLGTGALAIALHLRRAAVSLPWCAILFIFCVAYLIAVTTQLDGVIPASASLWIVPSGEYLYYQWMLVTPALFYALFRLGCFRSTSPPGPDAAISVGTAVSTPLAVWLFIEICSAFSFSPGAIFIACALFFTASAISIAALSRATLIAYRAAASRWPWMLGLLTFLVGIAGPIGGLLLNRELPFPADFQTIGVYVLAAVNGIALLMPNFASRPLHRCVWLLQCALFPFTLYFFLLFIPWLPLAIPLMLLFGAGFLIVTPMLLFLVHGQRLADGFVAEVRDGPRWKPFLLACAALLVIPAWLTGQALTDRVVLNGALNYFYTPDYLADHYDGNTSALRRSLQHLVDFKAGIQLPFLSDFYNWIVFDNLVLPDQKIQDISQAVFGTKLEPRPAAMFSPQSRGRGGTWAESALAAPPPTSQVAISQIQQRTEQEGLCQKTILHLDLRNSSGNGPVEYAGKITLPDGVLISGYKLNVGTELVPGRIFEKKTAQWVYRQIRDQTRRDPGILSYSGPNEVELRVYPFAPGQSRAAEIELLYPSVQAPVIQLDGRAIQLGQGTPAPAAGNWFSVFDDSGGALSLSPDGLPAAQRRPYLHFIVERSRDSQCDENSVLALIRQAAHRFPEASDCLITGANYQFRDITAAPVPLASVDAATLAGKLLPCEGGFLESRAIKRALLKYDARANQPGDHAWMDRYPVIIVLRGTPEDHPLDTDLAAFRRIAPDAALLRWHKGEPLPEEIPFSRPAQKVALLKYGDTIAPFGLADPGRQTLLFPSGSPAAPSVAVFNQQTKAFQQLAGITVIPPDSRFSRGMAARRDEWLLTAFPAARGNQLAAIVSRSRATGVLTPSTSYMVVEADAQWKIAERKEKQKLSNSSALELQEQAVPEPATIPLLATAAALLLLWRRCRRLGSP